MAGRLGQPVATPPSNIGVSGGSGRLRPPSPSPVQAPVESPSYFYTKTRSGATIGHSDRLDSSGKPFFDYRNPGDTSTSTDKTRVATTFNPMQTQPLSKSQYYTPRATPPDIRGRLGANSNQQVDHSIALTVGGSNDLSNLRAISTAKNQTAGKQEGRLANDLRSGTKSFFGA